MKLKNMARVLFVVGLILQATPPATAAGDAKAELDERGQLYVKNCGAMSGANWDASAICIDSFVDVYTEIFNCYERVKICTNGQLNESAVKSAIGDCDPIREEMTKECKNAIVWPYDPDQTP